MSIDLKITNLKNSLSKIINADNYSWFDLEKTFKIYESANFRVEIVRGLN